MVLSLFKTITKFILEQDYDYLDKLQVTIEITKQYNAFRALHAISRLKTNLI